MLPSVRVSVCRVALSVAARPFSVGCRSQAAVAATDPIQQLFASKVKEYAEKKKTSGGKLVDATPQMEADLKAELEKVARQYGGGQGVDMTKFPDFKWSEPKLQDIDLK